VDLTGDGRLETVFVRKGNLYVYSGKERLYKSPKQMGGSLSMLTYDYDPKAKNLRTITVSIEVPPVVANLDNDGAAELLAVNSEQSAMGLTGAGPGVKKSWLTALKFMERQFVEGEFGESFNDPVQGLGYSGSTIFVLTAEPESLFQRAVKNRLHAFPVAR
jgi:hypothetical protein